jgi:hypothetical protein
MIGGFIVWALHFLFIYGFTGLLCERPGMRDMELLGAGIVPAGIGLATIAALALLLLLALRAGLFTRRIEANAPLTDPGFLDYLALGAAGLSAVAIVWEGLFPVFVVPACG